MWKSRQPIASLHISQATHGYLFDLYPGATLRDCAMAYATQAVGVMQQMGAQGMAIWDLEAESASDGYTGSPDLATALHPELKPIIKPFLKVFHDAGFATGGCIRPAEYNRETGRLENSPDPLATLARKALYARNVLGMTILYIDTNYTEVGGGAILPAVYFDYLHRMLPDVLFIPEAETPRYYGQKNVAPYLALENGETGTPAAIREQYPGAFSVVEVNSGEIDGRHAELLEAVKAGDILLTDGWWLQGRVEKVRGIYGEAA